MGILAQQKEKRRVQFIAPPKAFTLAEVLITLVIIGVVAAISVPVMMNKYKWSQYRSSAWKAKNTLDNAMRMYQAREGVVPQCGISKKNSSNNSPCSNYDEEHNCIQWALYDDCGKVFEFLTKNLNVAKYCENNAYANGCIPDFDGIDTLYQKNNPDKTAEDAVTATNVWTEFRKARIQAKAAIVTTDGMIFIPYSTTYSSIWLIDINGQKGPNKWGHDIISLIGTMKNEFSSPIFEPSEVPYDKYGKTTKRLLYGKDQ